MIGELPNELELLATRSSSGDRRAFDMLVRRTHRLAYTVALRMLGNAQDADDVLQDAYLRVWQGLPGLREPSLVVSWICRIVRNVATDRARQRKRQRKQVDDSTELHALLEATTTDEPTAETSLANAQERATVASAVAGLRDNHRIVLLLREVDDMSYEDISAVLGIPIGTVESRLYRARRELAGKLTRLRQRARGEEAA